MKEKVLIIDSSPRAIDFTIQETKALFMGVEKGAWKLAQNNVTMAMAIGDFDSLNAVQLKRLRSVTNVIKLPSQKKHSDMESAILLAKSYGFTKIYIICDVARLDQLLVNIELVKKYSLIMFTNFGLVMKLTPILGDVYLRKHNYSYISFFPITQKVLITSSNELAYPIPKKLIKDDTSIYASNEILGPVLHLKVNEGEVLVVQATDPKFVTRRITD